ncbi:hypothetical protein AB0H98_01910 [Nocardia salmonicida]|uniref:hypothetical protein n=1 Tax=Nocardia salmonicida TaxID=53431 RepID=UPI0033E40A65
MARVSEHYGLTGDQSTFDFIDVELDSDTPLFIDPSVLASIDSAWAQSCVSAIQSYFQEVIDLIRSGKSDEARALLSRLREDNSTRLGYSSSNKGSGLGTGLADKFYSELSRSNAIKSGLISDIEDTALLVENVGEDRISDVVTNIIRRQLIEYTQQTASYYGIPLKSNVAISAYWDTRAKKWVGGLFDLPVPGGSPLLLVPKSIVRQLLLLNPGEYYRHYVLAYLQEDELNKNSPLVQVFKKNRVRYVTKVSVEEKYRRKHRQEGRQGISKRINMDATQQNPALIAAYKEDKTRNPPAAIGPEDLADATETPLPDLKTLLDAVVALEPGPTAADAYERAVEELLSAMLYPSLVNPVRQMKIHDGRKRIDLTYTNMGREDFFSWLRDNFPAATVAIECKNYSRSLANPEYDQLSGRFSPSRGWYGILVYRSYSDKDAVLRSMRDTANDDRGFMTPLDDEDLQTLVNEYKTLGSATSIGGLLHTRFMRLIN